jgi:hypothetical protein
LHRDRPKPFRSARLSGVDCCFTNSYCSACLNDKKDLKTWLLVGSFAPVTGLTPQCMAWWYGVIETSVWSSHYQHKGPSLWQIMQISWGQIWVSLTQQSMRKVLFQFSTETPTPCCCESWKSCFHWLIPPSLSTWNPSLPLTTSNCTKFTRI